MPKATSLITCSWHPLTIITFIISNTALQHMTWFSLTPKILVWHAPPIFHHDLQSCHTSLPILLARGPTALIAENPAALWKTPAQVFLCNKSSYKIFLCWILILEFIAIVNNWGNDENHPSGFVQQKSQTIYVGIIVCSINRVLLFSKF